MILFLFSILKNDIDNQNFAIFGSSVDNFGRRYDIKLKNAFFIINQSLNMVNQKFKSKTDSRFYPLVHNSIWLRCNKWFRPLINFSYNCLPLTCAALCFHLAFTRTSFFLAWVHSWMSLNLGIIMVVMLSYI